MQLMMMMMMKPHDDGAGEIAGIDAYHVVKPKYAGSLGRKSCTEESAGSDLCVVTQLGHNRQITTA